MQPLPLSHFDLPRQAWMVLRPLGMATALIVAAAAASYWYLLVPAEERLHMTQMAYQAERNQHAKLRWERKHQEEVLQLQRELEEVWTVLPEQKEFASMAVAISNLAGSERVSIPGMTYSHDKAEQGLPAKASLTFTATGRYKAIYRFIHRLERTEPYLVIEQLDAAQASSSREKGTPSVRFNIRVTTFLKPDPLQA